jgi:hypothetical protein
MNDVVMFSLNVFISVHYNFYYQYQTFSYNFVRICLILLIDYYICQRILPMRFRSVKPLHLVYFVQYAGTKLISIS